MLLAGDSTSTISGYGGVIFSIDSVLDVRFSLPMEIVPGLRLQRPTAVQLAAIKDAYDHSGRNSTFNRQSAWYEFEHEPAPTGGFVAKPLPPEKWRYAVLAVDLAQLTEPDVASAISALQLASPSVLSSIDLWSSAAFGEGDLLATRWQGRASSRLSYMPAPVLVDEAAVDDWRVSIGSLAVLNRSAHEGIVRAIELHDQVVRSAMPDGFELLGLFSVIEMLLTHKPGEQEIGDSLRHQVSTKIPLLSARMNEPLDLSVFGANCSGEKVWKSLYDLRSLYAHGEHIDFTRRPIAVLQNATVALTFVRESVRKLLRIAIVEPSLVDHLKRV